MDERHADQGMDGVLVWIRGVFARRVVLRFIAEQSDAFCENLLGETAVYVDGVLGAGDAVPSDNGGEFLGGAADENRAALGGDDIENHSEELPLERFDVVDGANCRADLQERLQVAGDALRGWKGGEGLGLEIAQIFTAKAGCGRVGLRALI